MTHAERKIAFNRLNNETSELHYTELKTARMEPLKCKLCPLKPSYISLGVSPLLTVSKYIEYVYQANPLNSLSSFR